MQRISIIGAPGAGKSSFAQALEKALGLDVFHLDMIFWTPDLYPIPRKDRETKLNAVLERESYILEGGYRWTFASRLADCDTLIWMDFPPHRRFVNVWRRHWSPKARVGQHPINPVNRSRVPVFWSPLGLLRHQYLDAQLYERAFATRRPGLRLIRLRSFAEAQAFLEGLGK